MVSDVAANTDTGRFAHIRFPALAWGEKRYRDQLGAANFASAGFCRRRGGESRLVDHFRLAAELGYARAFSWQHPHEVFCEHAALSGFENDGQRAFDIGGLADLSREAWMP